MVSELDALYAAYAKNPNDSALKMAIADCLIESGHESESAMWWGNQRKRHYYGGYGDGGGDGGDGDGGYGDGDGGYGDGYGDGDGGSIQLKPKGSVHV